MTHLPNPLELARWAENLEELDREVARAALLCRVRILEPGVVGRVLLKDASVCGATHPAAFMKLHDLLILHFAIREKAVEALGQAQTADVEAYVVERLQKVFPEMGRWPPV